MKEYEGLHYVLMDIITAISSPMTNVNRMLLVAYNATFDLKCDILKDSDAVDSREDMFL